MAFDPSDIARLSPSAQKQIADKLMQQARDKASKTSANTLEGSRKKYKNVPAMRTAESGKEIRFDSQKEAARYDELMLLLKAGKIQNLRLQPQFTLQEAYTTPEGERVRAIRYAADFFYERVPRTDDDGTYPATCNPWQNGTYVVEDVKSRATATAQYNMKKKILQERFGITVHEI